MVGKTSASLWGSNRGRYISRPVLNLLSYWGSSTNSMYVIELEKRGFVNDH